MSREEEFFKALNRAAFALFQIKRMNSDAIREHAATAYKEACAVLNAEPPTGKWVRDKDGFTFQAHDDQALIASYQLGSANRGGEGQS
jgi:hypothetical protein